MNIILTFKKLKDRIIPADEETISFFNSLQVGSIFHIDYKEKKQRALKYHKKYWAMLKVVMQNQEHFQTKDNLHETVKYRAGIYRTVIPYVGEPFIVVGSISFDKMDNAQFEAFMVKAKDVCVELVGDDALDEILRFL